MWSSGAIWLGASVNLAWIIPKSGFSGEESLSLVVLLPIIFQEISLGIKEFFPVNTSTVMKITL